jgi:hypothetical protein
MKKKTVISPNDVNNLSKFSGLFQALDIKAGREPRPKSRATTAFHDQSKIWLRPSPHPSHSRIPCSRAQPGLINHHAKIISLPKPGSNA